MKRELYLFLLGMILICQMVTAHNWWVAEDGTYCLYRVGFTAQFIDMDTVAIDCQINFAELLSAIGVEEELDVNSIMVIDPKRGLIQSSFLHDDTGSDKVCWEDFAYYPDEVKSYFIYFGTAQGTPSMGMKLKEKLQQLSRYLLFDDPEAVLEKQSGTASRFIRGPVLLSPDDGAKMATSIEQEFRWQPVSNATRYVIEFSEDLNFKSKGNVSTIAPDKIFYEWISKDEKEIEGTKFSLFLAEEELPVQEFLFFQGEVGKKEELLAGGLSLWEGAQLVGDRFASTKEAAFVITPIAWGAIQAPIDQAPHLVGEWDCYVVARSTGSVTLNTGMYDINAAKIHNGNMIAINDKDYKEYYFGRFTLPANMNLYFYLDGSVSKDDPNTALYVDKFILRPSSSLTYYWRVVAFDELGNPSYSNSKSFILTK
jgi:hypothetical protein